MNLLMIVLTVGTIEVLARVHAKQTLAGESLLGVLLYPKEWSQFSGTYQKIIDEKGRQGSYTTYDPMLGWTVAPSRSNKSGLYNHRYNKQHDHPK